MNTTILTILFAVAFIPLALCIFNVVKKPKIKKMMLLSNVIAIGMIIIASLTTAYAAGDATAAAETAVKGAISIGAGMGMLAAALSTGIACIGAGIAVAASASAAIGAMSENPAVFGKAMIFVALGEGVALYGLLISIQIINLL